MGVWRLARSLNKVRSAASLLTPRFVSSLLCNRFPDVDPAVLEVASASIVHVAMAGDGKASTTDRITLEVRLADSTQHAALGIPCRMVAKATLLPWYCRMGATPAMIRGAARIAGWLQVVRLDWILYRAINLYNYFLPHAPDAMYENEGLFYQRVRPLLGNLVETPNVYGTLVDTAGCRFVVLMDDLNEKGAVFPTALQSLSVAQVRNMLGSLARLHARYWRSTEFAPGGNLDWVPTPLHGGVQFVFDCLGEGLITDHVRSNPFEQRLLAPLGHSVATLWAGLLRAQESIASDPVTLCHGDTHIQNTYCLPDGSVGFFDFQLTLKANWARDVAYILGTALEPGERRLNERQLLEEYLAELGKLGVPAEDLHWAKSWDAYRKAMAWGLVIGWLICPPNNYGEEILSANVRRLVTACKDLGTFEVLLGKATMGVLLES